MSVQSVIEGKITFPPLDLDPVGLAPMSVEYGLWPGTRLTAPYARRPWLKFSLDERGRACGLECNPEVTEWGWGAHWGIGQLRQFVALHQDLDYEGHLEYLNDGGTDPAVLIYRFTVLPAPSGAGKWLYMTTPPSGGTSVFASSQDGMYLAPVRTDDDPWPDPAAEGLALQPVRRDPGTAPNEPVVQARWKAALKEWECFERRCPKEQDYYH